MTMRHYVHKPRRPALCIVTKPIVMASQVHVSVFGMRASMFPPELTVGGLRPRTPRSLRGDGVVRKSNVSGSSKVYTRTHDDRCNRRVECSTKIHHAAELRAQLQSARTSMGSLSGVQTNNDRPEQAGAGRPTDLNKDLDPPVATQLSRPPLPPCFTHNPTPSLRPGDPSS
ncbi:hypothetical protein PC119_g21522 [Phytophthora cactorum]|uniref:Uncharacterized protein n=1 Tax=Phytophthora cactorum TaxID=29920 RepID=A0A8T1BRI0_9STRA|nr:hypothetical protein PC114_g21966 [Phytophthora cactorum]KAG2908860.1 hypothetical protein PC117_g19842 [Phytophthora cactorum]KAG2979293.1 hypothetical protein PC119_g21522 [Phytophthora cactorum]KAG3134399.1 hypothetical protein C6341_g22177 [Phytophthora cactorum]